MLRNLYDVTGGAEHGAWLEFEPNGWGHQEWRVDVDERTGIAYSYCARRRDGMGLPHTIGLLEVSDLPEEP
jgi:hypothetical protein